MELRCKEGESAFVLYQEWPEGIPVGHVVKCLRYHPTTTWLNRDGSVDCIGHGVWHVEYHGQSRGEVGMFGVRDVHLLPIRNPGPDEVDEMVKLLGVPGEVATVLVGQGEEA